MRKAVVFLAGGFTSGQRDSGGVATYRDDAGRKVFDFCPGGDVQMRMAADVMGKLVCPIGLTTIKDKAPAAIAASVAAQVLMVREAVRNTAKIDETKPGRARRWPT